jgi:hypothetical protein
MRTSREKLEAQLRKLFPDMSPRDLKVLAVVISKITREYNAKIKQLNEQIGDRPIDYILLNKYLMEEQLSKYDKLGEKELVERFKKELAEIDEMLLNRYTLIKKLAKSSSNE